MPEAPEADVESLREKIDEEIERTGGRMIRFIALSTAILAALAAIASLRAGATVNEALVLKAEATQLQAEASDEWSYYQAKGIKGAIAELGDAILEIGRAVVEPEALPDLVDPDRALRQHRPYRFRAS